MPSVPASLLAGHLHDLRRVEGSGEACKDVGGHGRKHVRRRGLVRKDDDSDPWARSAYLLDQGEVFLDRRRWAGDDSVEPAFAECADSLDPARRGHDLEIVSRARSAERSEELWIECDEKDPGHRRLLLR